MEPNTYQGDDER